MTVPDSLLDRDATELSQLLLQHARGDRAPRAARERALLQLTSASLAAGSLAGAHAARSAGAAGKVTPWLIGKWVALGMAASLTTFATVEAVRHAWAPERETSRATAPAPRALPVVSPSAAPELPTPAQDVTVAPSATTAVGSVRSLAAPAPPQNAPVSAELPSATRFDSAESETSARLGREVALLQRARAALAGGGGAAALGVLHGYAQEFPSGALRAEAAALRIEAVASLGDRALARRLGAEFERSFPSSPLLARVRAVAGPTAPASKP